MTDFQEMHRLEELTLVHLFPATHLRVSGKKKFPLPPFQTEDDAGVVFSFVNREEIFYVPILARLYQLDKTHPHQRREVVWVQTMRVMS